MIELSRTAGSAGPPAGSSLSGWNGYGDEEEVLAEAGRRLLTLAKVVEAGKKSGG